MTMNSFNTEAQTIAIGLVSDAIKQSFIPLFDKLKELESRDIDEETSSKIDIIKIRLDVLFKVEMNLLTKIQEEYKSLGQNPGDFGPGVLFKTIEDRNEKFIESVMQGL